MALRDAYRDPRRVEALAARIRRRVSKPWRLMEVCGGQTHAILRFGIDQLLPEAIELIHGPGCPVCVTPVERIDLAIAITRQHPVTLCTFGDMLRVPGAVCDLQAARAQGADVRVIYSPLDALELARSAPERQVVLFAVGFETTAPAVALALLQARQAKLHNFSVLSAHVLVPPAMEEVLQSPECRVQAFLAAGHVCTVTGTHAYQRLARTYGVPIVATGFEPVDLLQGVLLAVEQLETGRAEVENAYGRAVRAEGNLHAVAAVEQVFEVCDRTWRGIGTLPASGLALAADFHDMDAERRFPVRHAHAPPVRSEDCGCIAGEVLKGLRKPPDCSAFGRACTPETPLGAPMVSSEGACAAYLRYRNAGVT